MEIIASCICSSIIAYAISVSCAKYYLNKLNEDWKDSLENNKDELIAQIEQLKKRMRH